MLAQKLKKTIEDGNKPFTIGESLLGGAHKLGGDNKKVPDIGFRVLKVDESNMVDIGRTPSTTTYKTLMESVDNIKQDRTAEDLLFDTMLRIGVPLSAKIEKKDMHDKTVFFVYYAEMLYLAAGFDKALNEALITDIAQMKPLHFVMRDASQETDSMATNFEEIFKLYSPSTKRWVL